MKTTVIQSDIVWASPNDNCRILEKKLDELPKSELYIFPEMFSTGFCTQPQGIAEKKGSEGTLQWMQKMAIKHNAAMAGSIATEEDGKFYNRFYFVFPDGNYKTYDKKHLFTYGGEHNTFTPGNERVVVEYKGIRILLQICYDLRFPVWSRNRNDYDMIIYVASWPTPRVQAWNALLKARAIENQCYVAGVNRVGSDPSCEYSGGTVIIDPYGYVMQKCNTGEEDAVTADIDMDELMKFRKKFPVLEDADSFSMID